MGGLAKRYIFRCRDVCFALKTPRPAATETSQSTDPSTDEFADLVESVIDIRLNGRQIRIELMDHHRYLVTYGRIRHYIRSARSRGRQHQQTPLDRSL
ncbi:hypothetical protein [Streptomyces sp. NPDC059479]|uniref:hypothetical protein n=1 Tax=Streptomyces sp. NPDC059479 TaxID=3346848 RepID=UPI003699F760